MEYSQEVIDKLRDRLPFNGRKEIEKRTGIPYSTICDALKTYREGGRPRYKARKMKIYNAAVDILNERGIGVN